MFVCLYLPSSGSLVFDTCVGPAVTGTEVSDFGMWAESVGMGSEGFVVLPGASSDGATGLPVLPCVSV